MTNKKKTNVLILGDLHYGSKSFNEDLFEQWLKDAKNYCKHSKRKKNGYILLNGDLIDMARATQDAWGSTASANEQIDFVVDALEPFRKNILYSTVSNHGSRAYKEFNFDADKEIASRLDIPYGIDCFVDVPFKGNQSRKIFMKHGTRSSKSYLLFMRAFMSDMNNVNADIYVTGHSHFLGSQTRVIREDDGLSKKHYVVNGSFLNYLNSYANKAGYDFVLGGYPIVSLDEKGVFNCRLVWSDDL